MPKPRAKGNGFEREVVNELKPTFPDAKRGLSQTRSGSECPDVDGTPMWIEAKRRRRVTTATIHEALAQADVSRDQRTPVAIVRSDREGPLACMRLSEWGELVRRAYANGQGRSMMEEYSAREVDGGAHGICGDVVPSAGDGCVLNAAWHGPHISDSDQEALDEMAKLYSAEGNDAG
jgi:hypothetical protein